MKQTPLLIAALVLVALSTALAQNTIVCPNTRTGNDTVDWSQLGPPGTLIPGNLTAYASPVPVTVSGSGSGGIQVLQEGLGGAGGFLGDFAIGDNLLGITPRYFLQFSIGISQVGAQVDPRYPLGAHVAILAYDQNNNQLGSCTLKVVNEGLQNDSAPYIGIAEVDSYNNPVTGIYSIRVDGFDMPLAINELSLTTNPPCSPPPNTQAASYLYGDVFGSSLNGLSGGGLVEEHMPNGTLVRSLIDGSGSGNSAGTTGTAFDVAGNFYVTNFQNGTVSQFDKTGTLINAALMTPGNDGLLFPESIRAVGTQANLSDLQLYVGGPNDGYPQNCSCILVYNSAGILQKTINVAGAGTTNGTDWIDFLTPNILIYTGQGTEIKAYDITTNTQLPDLINNLPAVADYQVRVGHPFSSSSCVVPSCTLPDPYILAADTGQALLVDPTPWLSANPIGSVPAVLTTTYSLPPLAEDFALAIDPDGIHFWTGDLGTATVWQINTCTGQVGYQWNATRLVPLGGLTVWGGLGSVW